MQHSRWGPSTFLKSLIFETEFKQDHSGVSFFSHLLIICMEIITCLSPLYHSCSCLSCAISVIINFIFMECCSSCMHVVIILFYVSCPIISKKIKKISNSYFLYLTPYPLGIWRDIGFWETGWSAFISFFDNKLRKNNLFIIWNHQILPINAVLERVLNGLSLEMYCLKYHTQCFPCVFSIVPL